MRTRSPFILGVVQKMMAIRRYHNNCTGSLVQQKEVFCCLEISFLQRHKAEIGGAGFGVLWLNPHDLPLIFPESNRWDQHDVYTPPLVDKRTLSGLSARSIFRLPEGRSDSFDYNLPSFRSSGNFSHSQRRLSSSSEPPTSFATSDATEQGRSSRHDRITRLVSDILRNAIFVKKIEIRY